MMGCVDRIAFAAGDIGGARALLPVARATVANGIDVHAMDHGPFRSEGAAGWRWHAPGAMRDPGFWNAADAPNVMIYATSVSDRAAIEAARCASTAGRPTLHVLDNWSSYAERLVGEGGLRFVPDAYAVMDELALREARSAGVPEDILVVTGHPGLAGLEREARRADPPRSDGAFRILFPSEPARADGSKPMGPRWRGYDEVGVSEAVARALRGCDVVLHVAPHPREDRAVVAERWDALSRAHGVPHAIVPTDGVRAALHGTCAVIGMSSVLLYEAWLLGLPVASVQPGARLPELHALESRDGLRFVTRRDRIRPALLGLLEEAADARRRPRHTLPRLASHVQAVDRISQLAERLLLHGSSSKNATRNSVRAADRGIFRSGEEF